jgi:hypothetical protein
MKYLKMLGLAAIAAAALMAFAGAGTASADELCTEPADATNMCPTGKLITEIHAIGEESAKLEDTNGNTIDTCTAHTVSISNITQGTTVRPIIAHHVTTIWENSGTRCTFPTITITNGSGESKHASGGGTTVIAKGTEVTINTFLFGSCVYGAGASLDLGSIPNGGDTISINVVVNKTGGNFACPTTAKWNAKYTVTNHNKVFYITN